MVFTRVVSRELWTRIEELNYCKVTGMNGKPCHCGPNSVDFREGE